MPIILPVFQGKELEVSGTNKETLGARKKKFARCPNRIAHGRNLIKLQDKFRFFNRDNELEKSFVRSLNLHANRPTRKIAYF